MRKILQALAVLVLMVPFVGRAGAQTTTGRLSGTVTDTSGAVLG